MRNLFFLVICLFSGIAWSQVMVKDTISGGEIIISGSIEIDSLVQKTIETSCSKPEPKTENIDPCADNPKVMGYKIQILYSKSRSNAEGAISEFNNEFPGFSTEMKYIAPDYKVLVGDYFTKRSAAVDLARIKKKFPSSFLVNWRVWCRKAK